MKINWNFLGEGGGGGGEKQETSCSREYGYFLELHNGSQRKITSKLVYQVWDCFIRMKPWLSKYQKKLETLYGIGRCHL